MTEQEYNHLDLLTQASNGNSEALKFLTAFQSLCHFIDDIIDEKDGRELIPQIFILAKSIYALSFYIQHQNSLSLIIDLITNAYEDSEDYMNNSEFGSWQRTVGNVIRSQCIDMTLAVACLCGGYLHMRKLSHQVRELSWKTQNSI